MLGLGVRAKQATEVKHQAAKEFFKEVRCLCGGSAGLSAAQIEAVGAGPASGCRPGAAASPAPLLPLLPLLRRRPPAACCLTACLPTPPQVCRCLPWVAHNYQLGELTTVPELRRNVTAMFRKYGDVKSPEVIDLLIYKGREELEVGLGGGAGLCD